MWIRGQTRAIVNLDYVTSIEARVMEASYSISERGPQWEVIAYRRPPGQDAILVNMLDARTAGAVVDRLGGAIMAEARLVDVLDLVEEVRYDAQKAAAKQSAITEASSNAPAPDGAPAGVTPS
jgi:hypothetical protein